MAIHLGDDAPDGAVAELALGHRDHLIPNLAGRRILSPELLEDQAEGEAKVVATSKLFVGRNWTAAQGRNGYSGLRVDIAEGRPLSIRLTPLVSCRDSNGWLDADPEPITLRS